jgi:hypothetical protein
MCTAAKEQLSREGEDNQVLDGSPDLTYLQIGHPQRTH